MLDVSTAAWPQETTYRIYMNEHQRRVLMAAGVQEIEWSNSPYLYPRPFGEPQFIVKTDWDSTLDHVREMVEVSRTLGNDDLLFRAKNDSYQFNKEAYRLWVNDGLPATDGHGRTICVRVLS